MIPSRDPQAPCWIACFNKHPPLPYCCKRLSMCTWIKCFKSHVPWWPKQLPVVQLLVRLALRHWQLWATHNNVSSPSSDPLNLQEQQQDELQQILQECLGDLLVPLALSTLAPTYWQLAASSASSFQHNHHHNPNHTRRLDPGAKLILRLGLYRLLLQWI